MAPEVSKDIAAAAKLIESGALVAMPTETVYGLAGDATNAEAIARIYETKQRPQFNPLIAHVSGIEMARSIAHVPALAEKLCDAFWPGPLTLVLERTEHCPVASLASAGLSSIAIRAPRHPMARQLIEAVVRPLVAPSANPSGTISPTRASHVVKSFEKGVAMILDGGPCAIGVESTIIKIADDTITMLRPGGVSLEALEETVQTPILVPTDQQTIEAPGMLESHYAPRATLRLNVREPADDEAYLAFGPAETGIRAHKQCLNLSPAGDLREAAANLFAHLHALDAICTKYGLSGIAAATIPNDGLGLAINDRLSRAAAPRSR